MSLRRAVLRCAACCALLGLLAALASAQQKPKPPNPFTPTNIKRAVVKFEGVSGMQVKLRTLDGTAFTLFVNPKVILLRNMQVAEPDQFKPGDKLVVYYNVPPPPETMKVLWAAMDPPSEILLVELKQKPVAAVFRSFDAASRRLTVQVGGRTVTYTMVAPCVAIREMDKAVLGRPNSEKQKGYAPGDKLLLIMTLDRKQVRMVMDQQTYDRIADGLAKFPVPPASQIPRR